MPEQAQMTFNNLKPNISNAIKESCPTTDGVIYKIADGISQIRTVSIEPGVEIAQGLSMLIDTIIRSSVCLGCDIAIIVKGILVGSFRSRNVELEAHKTIHLLIQEIMQAVFCYNADVKQMVNGILSGIVAVAQEHKLNAEEALLIAKENILVYANAENSKFAKAIKLAIVEGDGKKL
jgi:hypothetical protein